MNSTNKYRRLLNAIYAQCENGEDVSTSQLCYLFEVTPRAIAALQRLYIIRRTSSNTNHVIWLGQAPDDVMVDKVMESIRNNAVNTRTSEDRKYEKLSRESLATYQELKSIEEDIIALCGVLL